MGGLEDFCAYSQHYYNIVPSTSDDLDLKIAAENLNAFDSARLEQAQNKSVEPLHACITNASSPLAYHLASRILLNEVFGCNQMIHLHLLDTNENHESVQALAMELQDLAHHNLARVSCTDSPQEAFKAVSAVFVLDEFNRANINEEKTALTPSDHSKNIIEIVVSDCGSQIFGTPSQSGDLVDSLQLGKAENQEIINNEQQEEEGVVVQLSKEKSLSNDGGSSTELDSSGTGNVRPSSDNISNNDLDQYKSRDGDLLQQASKTYNLYGGILDYTAQKDVRVIIVGPYSNLGAALMAKRVSSINKRNFIASSGLVESQASSVIASKLGVASADVQHVGVWGRSQGRQLLLDVSCTKVSHFKGSIVGPEGFYLDIKKCLFDYKWLNQDFPQITLDRHCNKSSCYGDKGGVYLADAVSLVKVMKDWWNGNKGWHSVGVVMDDDIAVSCPCVCKDGVWERVDEASLEENRIKDLKKINAGLKNEFEMALAFVTSSDNGSMTNTDTPSSKL